MLNAIHSYDSFNMFGFFLDGVYVVNIYVLLEHVFFTGYAYGGLYELPESEYISCSVGSTIAGEIGVFGYRPSVMLGMFAGKRAEIGTKLGAWIFAYKSFASDIENDEITEILQETEDWLYDDESDEHDYTRKLSDLEKGSVTVVSYAKGKQTLNISEDD
ncbi:zinc protease PQQL-like protein isoform X1 [Tanacetum coccineum]